MLCYSLQLASSFAKCAIIFAVQDWNILALGLTNLEKRRLHGSVGRLDFENENGSGAHIRISSGVVEGAVAFVRTSGLQSGRLCARNPSSHAKASLLAHTPCAFASLRDPLVFFLAALRR